LFQFDEEAINLIALSISIRAESAQRVSLVTQPDLFGRFLANPSRVLHIPVTRAA
jgi:hypothetical protein